MAPCIRDEIAFAERGSYDYVALDISLCRIILGHVGAMVAFEVVMMWLLVPKQ